MRSAECSIPAQHGAGKPLGEAKCDLTAKESAEEVRFALPHGTQRLKPN